MRANKLSIRTMAEHPSLLLHPDPDRPLRRRAQIIVTRIDNEVVALNERQGSYFGLNSTASLIWDMLADPITPRTICERLEAAYEVEPEVCAREVGALLQQMLQDGVVERVDAA